MQNVECGMVAVILSLNAVFRTSHSALIKRAVCIFPFPFTHTNGEEGERNYEG